MLCAVVCTRCFVPWLSVGLRALCIVEWHRIEPFQSIPLSSGSPTCLVRATSPSSMPETIRETRSRSRFYAVSRRRMTCGGRHRPCSMYRHTHAHNTHSHAQATLTGSRHVHDSHIRTRTRTHPRWQLNLRLLVAWRRSATPMSFTFTVSAKSAPLYV